MAYEVIRGSPYAAAPTPSPYVAPIRLPIRPARVWGLTGGPYEVIRCEAYEVIRGSPYMRPYTVPIHGTHTRRPYAGGSTACVLYLWRRCLRGATHCPCERSSAATRICVRHSHAMKSTLWPGAPKPLDTSSQGTRCRSPSGAPRRVASLQPRRGSLSGRLSECPRRSALAARAPPARPRRRHGTASCAGMRTRRDSVSMRRPVWGREICVMRVAARHATLVRGQKKSFLSS
jgi:hypothetical protein